MRKCLLISIGILLIAMFAGGVASCLSTPRIYLDLKQMESTHAMKPEVVAYLDKQTIPWMNTVDHDGTIVGVGGSVVVWHCCWFRRVYFEYEFSPSGEMIDSLVELDSLAPF
jgi:hypothetical protein